MNRFLSIQERKCTYLFAQILCFVYCSKWFNTWKWFMRSIFVESTFFSLSIPSARFRYKSHPIPTVEVLFSWNWLNDRPRCRHFGMLKTFNWNVCGYDDCCRLHATVPPLQKLCKRMFGTAKMEFFSERRQFRQCNNGKPRQCVK